MTTPSSPLISVLMPVYNCERYLAEAIESVLNQTYPHFELMLINDGSTDNSLNVAERYNDPRIRIINNPENIGLVPTLNKGIELANGTYIARLDGDDRCEPTRFEKQVALMEANPDMGACCTGFYRCDENGNIIQYVSYPTDEGYLAYDLLYRNYICHSSVMFRVSLVKELGGYGKVESRAEDYMLWSRICHESRFGIVPEYLTWFRWHTQGVSHTYMPVQMNNASALSQENMEHLLGESLSYRLARIIFHFKLGYRFPVRDEELVEALEIMVRLYTTYLLKNPVSKSVHATIEKETAERLVKVVQPLGIVETVRFLVRNRDVLPAPIWTPRSLFLMFYDVKTNVKALLRMKNPKILEA